MNPQNQKQPCEPGRVARFADRRNRPAIGSDRNLGLGMRMSNGMSLAALVLGTAGSALAADLTVSMMPSHHQNEHYAKAVVGQPIQVWGKASGGDYAGYTIDFGDGSAPATGDSVPKPEFINSLHTYTHSGTFVASLSVTNTDGKVFDRKVNIKVVGTPSEQDEIDMAVEKGLLNLYQKWFESLDPTSPLDPNLNRVTVAEMGSALLAFQKSGHLSKNNPVADVYQDLVSRGVGSLQHQGPVSLLQVLTEEQKTQTIRDYFDTRALAISTLALIESMPSNPNSIGYSTRWSGGDGILIKNRMSEIFQRVQTLSSSGGVQNYLYSEIPGEAQAEAMDWVTLLATKYLKVAPLDSNFPSFAESLFASWRFLKSDPNVRVAISAGSILGSVAANVDLNDRYIQSDAASLVYNGFNSGIGSGKGWAGRIDTMFILANASLYTPDFSSEPANGVYYRDWNLPISRWLLGSPAGLTVDVPGNGAVEIAPNDRTSTKLFGQNPDGSWTGPQLSYPNDVVSTPIVTTALAVSTLIREDVTPSEDQIHAEYGSNFVSVSGGDNHPPIFGNDSNIGSDGMLTFSVSDADNDLIKIDFMPDGIQGGTIHVNGGGSVIYKGSNVKPLYGTNSLVVKIVDGWSENYRTWLIERPDTKDPYFKVTPTSITIPTDPGRATAAYYPLVYAYDLLGDGSETVIVPKINISHGQELSVGMHPVIATATDPAGHQATLMYNVTVVDQEPPRIAQRFFTMNTEPGSKFCKFSLPTPSATDNSGFFEWTYKLSDSLIGGSSGAFPAYSFPIGKSSVALEVKDPSNNVSTSVIDVTVSDQEAPVVSPVAPITVTAALGKSNAPVTIPGFSASDNSGVFIRWVIVPNVSTNMVSGTGLYLTFPIGSTSVRYVATDPFGNSSFVTSTVTVRDVELPKFVYIPPVSVSSGTAGSVTLSSSDLISKLSAAGLKVTDNEGKTPTLTISSTVPSTFNKGTTTWIPITATDSSGNSTMGPFALRVL